MAVKKAVTTPQTSFDQAFAFTLGNEGKFSNVPGDAGGATMYGITLATLSRWRKRPCSVNDVRNLSLAEAKSCYRAWYWDTLDLDSVVHTGCAMAIFDIGVVRGIGAPPAEIQSICNAHGSDLIVDGHIGPKTIEALNEIPSAAFIRDFSVKVENDFRAIAASHANDRQFLKGWVARAHRLLTLVAIPDVASAKQVIANVEPVDLVQTAEMPA